ncbi:MAG TPA: hypothetical protein VIK89_05795 [Cytophagaceae bacterium]
MKTLINCFLLLSVFVMVSCTEKITEMSSVSPDGRHTLVITGKKPNFADPWQVIFQKKGKEAAEAPMTEIYAGDLNDKNVTFEWIDNVTVKIHFLQQDDTERIIIAHFNDNGLKVSQ